jgi:16S rRNA (cytosine1402-N4)-methyltransferase
MYHNPVMLIESLEGLSINPNGIYVDVTFGGGGHSRAILNHLSDDGRLLAFDQDDDAKENIPDDERFILIPQNFRYIKNFLKLYKAFPVDGIIADLGISSHQIDKAERGFSIRFNGELDLRMNQNQNKSAKEVVNEYSEVELKRVFKDYGELSNAWKIANAIVKYRTINEIENTEHLKDAVINCLPRKFENKTLAMIFQAIRIEVNEELEVLKELLLHSVDCLKPGGRLVVISYHSLEDRLVKNFMKSGNFKGDIEKDFYGNIISPLKSISRKAIVPNSDEVERNSRSRSAKLRIAEKNEYGK